jgi:hypothetical protein
MTHMLRLMRPPFPGFRFVLMAGVVASTFGAASASALPITQLSSAAEIVGLTTSIDFNGLPLGPFANTAFSSLGVTFEYDTPGLMSIMDGINHWAPTNVAAAISSGGGTFSRHINLLFDAPTSSVGAMFGNDQDVIFTQVTLSVFDVGDNLLGSVSVLTNNNTAVDQFIGLTSTTPFVRARFENIQPSDSYSVMLDDVVFSAAEDAGPAPVPEPASLFLLGTGVVAVAWACRRRSMAHVGRTGA